MKKILILGGFGFIGTNILKYIDLYRKDVGVVIFDLKSSHPYGVDFKCVECTYAGDLSDIGLMNRILSEHKFDYIIHLVSSTYPLKSDNPKFDIESNLIPSVNFFRAAAEHKVENIIFISSGGAIYGQTNSEHRHVESDVAFPISSYGVVKLAIEKYLFQTAVLYPIKPLVLRLSNPFGRYHFSLKQGICNVAMRKALNGDTFTIWGDGSAKKDYFFIDDFCRILFMLIDKDINFRILNIASGNMLSVNDIMAAVKKIVPDFKWTYSQPLQTDVRHFELDTTALMRIIGSFKFTDFNVALMQTYEWLKSAGNL